MAILVTYASKHGATQGIAERIAEKLRLLGKQVEVQPIKAVRTVGAYEAIVIGAAAYYGSWMKEASEFVRSNRESLASRPVWMFSSGPVGEGEVDEKGQDKRKVAAPKEFAEFSAAIRPREQQVFFGVVNRSKMGFAERMFANLPAGRTLLPEGDFRDWPEIDAWAERIAAALTPAPSAP